VHAACHWTGIDGRPLRHVSIGRFQLQSEGGTLVGYICIALSAEVWCPKSELLEFVASFPGG
jgi:hypothetical protein